MRVDKYLIDLPHYFLENILHNLRSDKNYPTPSEVREKLSDPGVRYFTYREGKNISSCIQNVFPNKYF